MSFCLSFMIRDKKGRVHILEISLPRNYPESSPTIAAVSSVTYSSFKLFIFYYGLAVIK